MLSTTQAVFSFSQIVLKMSCWFVGIRVQRVHIAFGCEMGLLGLLIYW